MLTELGNVIFREVEKTQYFWKKVHVYRHIISSSLKLNYAKNSQKFWLQQHMENIITHNLSLSSPRYFLVDTGPAPVLALITMRLDPACEKKSASCSSRCIVINSNTTQAWCFHHHRWGSLLSIVAACLLRWTPGYNCIANLVSKIIGVLYQSHRFGIELAA